MHGFEQIPVDQCTANFMHELHENYCLVSATADGVTNQLTAAWAQVGHVWQRFVATVYIRPSRRTRELMDASGRFTMCFFGEFTPDLYYLGRHSGHDEPDKLERTSLHLLSYEGDPIYEEAKLALVCKTIYVQQVDLSGLLEPAIVADHYPEGNVSLQYMGQIEKVLVRQPVQR